MNADWDASAKLSNVKVAQSATAPTEPVFPPKPLFLALGGVVGLVGGAGVCVMFEAINARRSRTEHELRLAPVVDERFSDRGPPDDWERAYEMADYRFRGKGPVA
jgi:succinoglycan biosynthesis transport protein ExoP